MKKNSSIFSKVLQGGKLVKGGFIVLLLIAVMTMLTSTQVHAAKIAFSDNAAKITAMTMAVPDNAASVTTDCTTITTTKWVRSTTATGQSQDKAVAEITTTAKKAMTPMDVTKPDKANCLRNENLSDVNCTVDLVTVEASPQAVSATSDVFQISKLPVNAEFTFRCDQATSMFMVKKTAPANVMCSKTQILKDHTGDAAAFSSSTTG